MSESQPRKKPSNLYEIINLDIAQTYLPKKKKESNNNNNVSKEDLNLTKGLSSLSSTYTASMSQSPAPAKNSSNNKVEISIKKYFEHSFRSDHVNKRVPTEDDIINAFKFYD